MRLRRISVPATAKVSYFANTEVSPACSWEPITHRVVSKHLRMEFGGRHYYYDEEFPFRKGRKNEKTYPVICRETGEEVRLVIT